MILAGNTMCPYKWAMRMECFRRCVSKLLLERSHPSYSPTLRRAPTYILFRSALMLCAFKLHPINPDTGGESSRGFIPLKLVNSLVPLWGLTSSGSRCGPNRILAAPSERQWT